MSTINIKCIDQVLTFTNTPVITTGDQNIDNIAIDFCPLWDGYIKVGIFFKQKGEFSYSLINADGSCPIPNSICNLTGKIYFAVSGTNANNQVRTSNIVCYTIEDGVADSHIQDEFPDDITDEEKQDIYNQILRLALEMQSLCQDLIKNFAYVRIKSDSDFSYDVSSLQAQINAYTYAKTVIDQKINTLTNSLNTTNNKVSTNTQNISANTSAIESINEEIERLGVSITEVDERLLSQWDSIQEQFDNVDSNISKVSEKITGLNDKIEDLENTQLKTMNDQIEEHTSLIEKTVTQEEYTNDKEEFETYKQNISMQLLTIEARLDALES